MAGKVCNSGHLRFCGDKWYFQYQHYGFPGVTILRINVPFCLCQGREPAELCQKGCPRAPISPTSPSHTGDQGNSNNSPLARDPKSQVTLSSPHVPHQQQWCLREGRGAVVKLHGEEQGGMAAERSTRRVVPTAVPSHAQHTELMGCWHQHHSGEKQHPSCIAPCEARIWEKIPQVCQWDKGFLSLMILRNFSFR